MPLDLNATVTIELSGLMIIDKTQEGFCSVGIVSCAQHELRVTIHKILQNSSQLLHTLKPTQDITIDVTPGGQQAGVAFHKDAAFDRKSTPPSNRNDHRWVIDLQGEILDGAPLVPAPPGPNTFSASIKPRLLIKHGKLYTASIHPDQFARVRREPGAPPDTEGRRLGRVADKVGIDITCPDVADSAVTVSGLGALGVADPLVLKRENGVSYFITVKNECTTPVTLHTSSDFIIYSDVLNTGNLVFDLREVIANGGNTAGTEVLEDEPDFTLGQNPRVCNPARSSSTG
jgi:hypothetical protein